jgi:hypothetical protein
VNVARDATLVCPACGYDVSRTLADGIQTCPECGADLEEGALDSATLNERVLGIARPFEHIASTAGSVITLFFIFAVDRAHLLALSAYLVPVVFVLSGALRATDERRAYPALLTREPSWITVFGRELVRAGARA